MSTELMIRHGQLSMNYSAGARARAEYALDCADEHNLNKITTTETRGCLDEFRHVFGPGWDWGLEGEYLTGVDLADGTPGRSWLSRESRRFTGSSDWRDAWAMNQYIRWDTGYNRDRGDDEAARALRAFLTVFAGDTNVDLRRWVWRKYLDGSLHMDSLWSDPSRPKRGTHGGKGDQPGARGIDVISASVPIVQRGLVKPNPRDYDKRIDHRGVWCAYPAAKTDLTVVSHLSSAVQDQATWSAFTAGVGSHRDATAAIGDRLLEKREQNRGRHPHAGDHGTIKPYRPGHGKPLRGDR